jgi:sortase (surface protein transpeptidase)
LKTLKLLSISLLAALCVVAGSAGPLAHAQFARKSTVHKTAVHKTPVKKPNKSAPKQPTLYVPPGNPQTVVISKIHVKAPVESLNLNLKAQKDAPHKWGDVAWYDLSPKPGAVGRASVFGHLDSYCCPAVFWELHTLRPGDIVQVYYKTGKPISFKVQWGTSYTNKKLPLKFIFGRTTERGLVLLTCFGVFSKVSGYSGKWMVYARAILPNGKLG